MLFESFEAGANGNFHCSNSWNSCCMGKHRHGFSAAMACMTAGVLATVALRRAAFSSELHLPNCSRLCYSL